MSYPYEVPRGLLQRAEAEEELKRSLVLTDRLRVLDKWPASLRGLMDEKRRGLDTPGAATGTGTGASSTKGQGGSSIKASGSGCGSGGAKVARLVRRGVRGGIDIDIDIDIVWEGGGMASSASCCHCCCFIARCKSTKKKTRGVSMTGWLSCAACELLSPVATPRVSPCPSCHAHLTSHTQRTHI